MSCLQEHKTETYHPQQQRSEQLATLDVLLLLLNVLKG